jgi:signal transduction histidine kinase/CheY-like chemotaxis protein
MRPATCGTLVMLVASALWPRPSGAQPELDLSHWRFYSSVDGLRESWVEDITPGRDGRLWITHGSVDAMTLFDGYTFQRLRTPGPNLTVREGPTGQVWALRRGPANTIDGAQVFERDSWTPIPVSGIAGLGLTGSRFAPWAADRVLLIGVDRLVELDRTAGVLRVVRLASETPLRAFTSFEVQRTGAVWLGGRGQLVLASPGARPGAIVLHDEPLPGELADDDVRVIHDAGRDGLFVTTRAADGRGTVLRLRDGAWRTLVRDVEPDVSTRAWAAADEMWMSRSTGRTFMLGATTENDPTTVLPVRRSRALSGQLHTVLVEPEGAFWVATSLGLARHAPTVWRTPPELGRFERHVSTLFESRSGDLFAAADSVLLHLPRGGPHQGRWRVIPLPAGVTPIDVADGMAELPDGRLIFNAPAPKPAPLLIFDPRTETFEWFRHPNGRRLDLLATSDGSPPMWLHTRAEGKSFLERYDGDTFTELYDAGTTWNTAPPRGLLVASTGDVFVLPEQTGIGWLARSGRYRRIGAADGYEGAGPFCGLEVAPGRYWFGDRDAIVELALRDANVVGRAAEIFAWRVVRSGMQTVRSLVRARDGTIWAAAGSGLHAYRNGSWVTMTVIEGLPDGGVYDVRQASDGVIWASTSLGLARLYAETDVDPPRTHLDPALNPREAPPSGDVRLSFAGQDRWDRSPPRRLLYSWRLDAGPWSPFVAEAGASFQGLLAGAHRIDVRAMDRNWNIDPKPAAWEIRVLLPWYRETGFLAVGIAGALALCAVVGLVASRQVRLGRLVAERTHALAESNRQIRRELEDRQRVEEERARLETQLHQAHKLEAIGRLAGGIAHDFNNLLTVITSYGELIQQDLPSGHPFATPVAEIVAASDRATALTRQLLAFGRHQVRHPQPLDLNDVLLGIERMLGRLIGEDIDLECRPDRDACAVLADRGQIEQIIVNLAVNARDAMPEGGKLTIETDRVEIDEEFVRAHAGVAPGRYVRLSVSDTGVGMDATTQERIFEPFFTTKAREKGSGLGLATVYGIVRQTGGHVWVYSEPGRGASFKIYLPCTEAPIVRAAPPPRAARPRGAERVLLVEDDGAVRLLTSTVLRGLGYQVIEAPSAEEAEGLIDGDGEGIDLVVSDIVLPGISGPQLAERLRATRPFLRVLFMSGYADDAVIRHGILETEVAFIQKPFTPDALARKVRETLDA